MESTGKVESARVFFALSPEEHCRRRLSAIADGLAARCGGRATSQEALHLTLVFVGELPLPRLPDLLAAASDVAQAVGEASAAGLFVLDRLRYQPRGKMLWATCADCPPRLSALAAALAARLFAQGLVVELRPWLAHVTLLRRVAVLPSSADLEALRRAPVRWPYRDFVLLRSFPGVAGAGYECLGRWPLRGG